MIAAHNIQNRAALGFPPAHLIIRAPCIVSSRLVVRVQRVGATLARSLLVGVSKPKVFRGR
jgi:hypothetical protein